MKRARTGTFTHKATRQMTLPTAAGQSTGANRRLTAAEKKEVKALINKAAPKSTTHNSATSGVPPVTGVLASAATPILAFTALQQGLSEHQRRGDQVYIDKIVFRAYLSSTAAADHVRFLVVRQPRSGFPPLPVDPTAILQNAGAGTPGIISSIQDDQPCQILYDKVVKVGNNTVSGFSSTVHEFTLDYTKAPKRAVFLDGTAISGPATTVEGDIELICATHSAGATTMTYVYDVVFHEK